MRAIALVLLLAMGLNGCFAYAPFSEGTSYPGRAAPVRLQLSSPMDFPIRDITVRDVASVRGEMISADADTVRVSAYGLRSVTGYEVQAHGETVGVPRGLIVGVEQRRISRLQTALMAGLVIGITVIAGLATGTISGGGDNTGGGGQPK